MKQKFFIDTHKGLTPIFIIFLINYFNQWNNYVAIMYLALHGTYGLLWITKSKIFPDKQWEENSSIYYGLFIWFGLSLYWVSPYLIVSGIEILPFSIKITPLYLLLCFVIYIIGVFLHFTSDMQKHSHLKLNPGKLIKDGMFLKNRNTNYLGELFIYLGFSLLAVDWFPLVCLIIIIVIIWIPNMIKKDKSLSKYPDFKEYKKKSKIFFPFI
tara:strand:- start:2480 stop:3115 length:636 start_codon:yes stop_codon:yes gene_type:complete